MGDVSVVIAGYNSKPQVKKTPARCWTEEKRARFLDHLAQTCNLAASVKVAGMKSMSNLHRLRRRDAGFRAAWDEALAQGYARLEAELLDRAINGKRVMVERGGKTVEMTQTSDALGLQLLAHHRRAVASYRAAVAAALPREDVSVVRTRIVDQIMTIVDALPDRDGPAGTV